MFMRISAIAVVGSSVVVMTGCASSFSNLVSGSELGAAEYQPAVLVPPEKQVEPGVGERQSIDRLHRLERRN